MHGATLDLHALDKDMSHITSLIMYQTMPPVHFQACLTPHLCTRLKQRHESYIPDGATLDLHASDKDMPHAPYLCTWHESESVTKTRATCLPHVQPRQTKTYGTYLRLLCLLLSIGTRSCSTVVTSTTLAVNSNKPRDAAILYYLPITRKVLDRFAWNFQGSCGVTIGRPDYT